MTSSEELYTREKALRQAIPALSAALAGVVRATTDAHWTGPAFDVYADELNARRHELARLVAEAEAKADDLLEDARRIRLIELAERALRSRLPPSL